MAKDQLIEVILKREISDIELYDHKDVVNVSLKTETFKAEVIKQLTALYNLCGIKTVRRTELLSMCVKKHGLLKTDTSWGKLWEKALDDLADENVTERIRYKVSDGSAKQATYVKFTNKYIKDNLI